MWPLPAPYGVRHAGGSMPAAPASMAWSSSSLAGSLCGTRSRFAADHKYLRESMHNTHAHTCFGNAACLGQSPSMGRAPSGGHSKGGARPRQATASEETQSAPPLDSQEGPWGFEELRRVAGHHRREDHVPCATAPWQCRTATPAESGLSARPGRIAHRPRAPPGDESPGLPATLGAALVRPRRGPPPSRGSRPWAAGPGSRGIPHAPPPRGAPAPSAG
mmetsp:Transcript_7762/g.22087  ORF Transcript_7762/g.22087 Transcript_7762/m.22087 type:complete len:219 (+) Transcript_7762:121-777(+)